jgi:hypothetical protein
VLGRYAEALEPGLREVEDLLPPQERVVRVVVGVGGVDEEPHREAEAEHAERDAGDRVGVERADARERGPPGEGQAFHERGTG